MSPKRGDRVTVPPPGDEWDVRFGTSDAVKAGRNHAVMPWPIHADAWRRCEEIHAHAPITSAGIACVATLRLIVTTDRTWSNGSSRSPTAGACAT